MFHVVAKPRISGKSCEIHKNLPNTCRHNILLKEQMKMSVVVKQIENCLLYFFLSKPKQVVQLVIISRENENQMHPFPYAVGY